MAQFTDAHGRTSDHYKVQRPSPDRKRDVEPPPDAEVPDYDERGPDDSEWEDERRRQERGNRGPDEEPGFGQGA